MGSLRISKDTKQMNIIPKGSKILGKDVSTEVEEIENGFIITKRTEIKFSYKTPDNSERTDYSYQTKKWFSKEDPLTINISDKNLADAFTE
jgi:hypothetical protein